MKIKFNNLKKEHNLVKLEFSKKLKRLFNDSDYINGKEVNIFEDNIKTLTKSKYAISCGNGTDALQISLMCLNLRKGDEVIMQAFSYISILETTVLLGLKPVLVDVDYDTFHIDENKLEKKITQKTKVIVPVHLFGQNSNMSKIRKIAKRYNLFIIEDAAQSISSNNIVGKNKIQSGNMGDIGCFSFFPTKNLGSYGDGGAIITNNRSLYNRIKMIRNHGQKVKYKHDLLGVNSRLDTIQACVLNSKIKILKKNNKARINNAKIYFNLLKKNKNIILPKKVDYSDHIFHQFTIKVLYGKRNKLIEYLKTFGVPSIIYYPSPMHKNGAYKSFFNKSNDLLMSEKLSNEVLSLPIHPYLFKKEIVFISNKINKFLND